MKADPTNQTPIASIEPVSRSEFDGARLTGAEFDFIAQLGAKGQYLAEKRHFFPFTEASHRFYNDLDLGGTLSVEATTHLEEVGIAGFNGDCCWLTLRGIAFYRAIKG